MFSGKNFVLGYFSPKSVLKGLRSRINAKRALKIFPNVTPDEYSNQISAIRMIDKCIVGRYCGSLENKIMQTMSCYDVASRFPSNKQYAHVEIGVLFGGSTLAKLSVLKRLNIKQSVIAIDPFEGYYQKPKDPVTGLEVTEQNFRKNIQKFGFDNEMLQIIKKYSTDEGVMPLLSQYKIISLMIDGDHTYSGIKNDWEKYSHLVQSGGYVVFDDFEDPCWPDITRFVNELIDSKPQGWEVFGKLDTTLIMKRN